MGKLLYTYPILAVALLFFLCSCTKEKGDMPQQNDETKFVLATKAGAGSELTFRIMPLKKASLKSASLPVRSETARD